MVDLTSIFTKPRPSKDMAKDRLKLVLIHDRANVSPQFLDMIKSEIIKVISNYMEIDEKGLDIQLTRTRSENGKNLIPALIANIPIKTVKNSGR